MPMIYLQQTDGARIPLAVDAQGRLVLAPGSTISASVVEPLLTRIQGYDGADWENVRVDSSTNTMQVINYEHHEIHGGSHYFYEDYTTLNNGATIDFGVLTPDTTKWTHIVWNIQSTGVITFQVYEGSTVTWDGSNLTSRNNNRNSANTSNWAQFQSDPSVGAVGTLIAQLQVGSSTSPNRGIPGGGDRNKEIILKQNTAYIFRITSGVNSNVITYLAEWYEHTNK